MPTTATRPLSERSANARAIRLAFPTMLACHEAYQKRLLAPTAPGGVHHSRANRATPRRCVDRPRAQPLDRRPAYANSGSAAPHWVPNLFADARYGSRVHVPVPPASEWLRRRYAPGRTARPPRASAVAKTPRVASRKLLQGSQIAHPGGESGPVLLHRLQPLRG